MELESHDARICIESALLLEKDGYTHLAKELWKIASKFQDAWLVSRNPANNTTQDG